MEIFTKDVYEYLTNFADDKTVLRGNRYARFCKLPRNR